MVVGVRKQGAPRTQRRLRSKYDDGDIGGAFLEAEIASDRVVADEVTGRGVGGQLGHDLVGDVLGVVSETDEDVMADHERHHR